MTLTLMSFKNGIDRSLNFRRRQFLKVNTSSVRFSQNILKNQIGANVRSRVITMQQNDGGTLRSIKVVLMNKLYKIKSTLRLQLADEICKPITDHKSFVEIQDEIELLISMVEMAFCLPYKHIFILHVLS